MRGGRAIKKAVRRDVKKTSRTRHFWWFSPLAGILYPPGWIEIYRIAYAIEVTLAMVGAVVVWRRDWRQGSLFLILMMVLIGASQTLFYVEGRHR